MCECAEQIKSNKCVVRYGAGAIKHLYWFDEFRIIVTLLGEGKTLADIKLLTETRNIFSAPTDCRSTQIFITVSKRILTLNFQIGDSKSLPIIVRLETLVENLIHSNIAISKQIETHLKPHGISNAIH
jgi:hypothetical protein